MIENINEILTANYSSIIYAANIINFFLHVIFAGAVARDAGSLYKRGCPTILVSGVTWSFATLIGGVFIAAIYWILHHSSITRPSNK